MHPTPPRPDGRFAGPPVARPPVGPPSFAEQPSADLELTGLRRSARRLDRGLITANVACFLALVLLAGAAPGLLATEIVGRLNLGLLLCWILGALAFLTTVGYDLSSARTCDPAAARIRTRRREAAAPPPAAPTRHRTAHRRSQW